MEVHAINRCPKAAKSADDAPHIADSLVLRRKVRRRVHEMAGIEQEARALMMRAAQEMVGEPRIEERQPRPPEILIEEQAVLGQYVHNHIDELERRLDDLGRTIGMTAMIKLARPRLRNVEHDIPCSCPHGLADVAAPEIDPRFARLPERRLPCGPAPIFSHERFSVSAPEIHPAGPEPQMHALNPIRWKLRGLPILIERELEAVQPVPRKKRRKRRRIAAEDAVDFIADSAASRAPALSSPPAGMPPAHAITNHRLRREARSDTSSDSGPNGRSSGNGRPSQPRRQPHRVPDSRRSSRRRHPSPRSQEKP